MHLNDGVLAAGHLEDAVFILFNIFFIVLNNYWLLQTRFCSDVSEILNEGKIFLTYISPIRVLLCIK